MRTLRFVSVRCGSPRSRCSYRHPPRTDPRIRTIVTEEARWLTSSLRRYTTRKSTSTYRRRPCNSARSSTSRRLNKRSYTTSKRSATSADEGCQGQDRPKRLRRRRPRPHSRHLIVLQSGTHRAAREMVEQPSELPVPVARLSDQPMADALTVLHRAIGSRRSVRLRRDHERRDRVAAPDEAEVLSVLNEVFDRGDTYGRTVNTQDRALSRPRLAWWSN